jgi:hypothetical protein
MAVSINAQSTVQDSLTRMRTDLGASTDHDLPRGAVGAFADSGDVLYGYPESAGYWLQWASRRPDVSASHGERVIGWLARIQRAHGGWPTRVARGGTEEDSTGYLFDHGMVWHGLRCWASHRGDALAGRLAEEVLEATQLFAVNGNLVAGCGPVPIRWSALAGPFLLKACARLRHAEGPIAAACAKSVPALVEQCRLAPHIEAHPQLYAIEGLIVLGHAVEARTALALLCKRHGGLGGIRESTLGGPRRSDVLAQLLRAALMLGLARRDDPAWSQLVKELLGRIHENGRVVFSDSDATCPTWAALFCEQALTLWEGGSLVAGELV